MSFTKGFHSIDDNIAPMQTTMHFTDATFTFRDELFLYLFQLGLLDLAT